MGFLKTSPLLRRAAAVLTIATLLLLSVLPTSAFNVPPLARSLATKPAFKWLPDPHATDPCTDAPGCVNNVKYGFTLAPVNISTSVSVVFQTADRPTGLSAVLNLETYTQPGCVMSGCHTTKMLGVLPQEECFNVQVRKKPDQPDGVSAHIDFGGIYYEHLPAGELYVKFERTNYLSKTDTCTFEVRSGYKRWF